MEIIVDVGVLIAILRFGGCKFYGSCNSYRLCYFWQRADLRVSVRGYRYCNVYFSGVCRLFLVCYCGGRRWGIEYHPSRCLFHCHCVLVHRECNSGVPNWNDVRDTGCRGAGVVKIGICWCHGDLISPSVTSSWRWHHWTRSKLGSKVIGAMLSRILLRRFCFYLRTWREDD